MKFGKSLSNQIEETLPEWRDKFLSYKELKKKLKLIEPNRIAGAGERPSKKARVSDEGGDREVAAMMTKEEIDFIRLLEDELEKFNSFFVEKEEEYIIRLKELQDGVAKAKEYSDEMMKIRKEIVDFHGEMVLLENYSALNYTGLVKILKKYDKRTGALIRLPFIRKVLQQPFFTTDLLYKLVKECESLLDRLFPKLEPLQSVATTTTEPTDPTATTTEPTDPTTTDDQHHQGSNGPAASTATNNDVSLILPKELAEIEYIESLYMKSTISALRVLKEIRSGSSTVSAFSLPPLQVSGLDEAWKKVPVLEQEAK